MGLLMAVLVAIAWTIGLINEQTSERLIDWADRTFFD